ncbi:MAG TPA: LUD domain-containing protein [Acholeplasmataceae bacterium]|nr:LUD domain-containing protein [Acholeplasmataceae bacterium]
MDYSLLERNFNKRGYNVHIFKTKEEAVSFIEKEVENENVGFGASITLQELNLAEILQKKNNLIWHWNVPGKKTLELARFTDVYFSSANAVSMEGDIVNIDGTGNRISMLAYGPKKAYIIIGKNKIVPTLEDAIERARNVAAPLNARRLNKKTPCVKTGKCEDCNSSERICRGILIITHLLTGMKYEIIFIDEDLGY